MTPADNNAFRPPAGPGPYFGPEGSRLAARLRIAALLLAPVLGSLFLAILFGHLLVPDRGPEAQRPEAVGTVAPRR
ncbi:hypothetical protein [Prosthecomicrobium sp. N25]|uniref:hypothetical protein n=1 Tax=Prosthecomicrobium sp. N25 TaxID=3129254 RepID=UPI0030783587